MPWVSYHTHNTAAIKPISAACLPVCAAPVQMQALLGPSGAGKSTLMDILALRGGAGRRCVDGGTVLVNGQARVAKDFLARSAYVPQVRLRAVAWAVQQYNGAAVQSVLLTRPCQRPAEQRPAGTPCSITADSLS